MGSPPLGSEATELRHRCAGMAGRQRPAARCAPCADAQGRMKQAPFRPSGTYPDASALRSNKSAGWT